MSVGQNEHARLEDRVEMGAAMAGAVIVAVMVVVMVTLPGAAPRLDVLQYVRIVCVYESVCECVSVCTSGMQSSMLLQAQAQHVRRACLPCMDGMYTNKHPGTSVQGSSV